MKQELTLHEAKMDLLRVVDQIQSVDEIRVIRQILTNYYAMKVDEEMDRLWDNGLINKRVIDQWGREHMRTSYHHA